MRSAAFRTTFLLVFVLGGIQARAAGQIPQLPPGVTPEDVLSRPELAGLLRQRIQESGLSPDEIRSRLRAAGYSGSLLDAYLGETLDSTAAAPGADVLRAVNALGVELSPQDSLVFAGDTVALRLLEDSLRAEQIALEDSTGAQLTLFGLEVFRQPTTQFQPMVTGPVASDYHLGPGDGLVLLLAGDVELAHSVNITPEGFIFVPNVGQIFLNNLTLEQARRVVRDRLARSYSGIRTGTTTFELTVSRIRVNSVRVLGEVARPGTYQLAATASVVSALYEAGGLTDLSNFREVLLLRGPDTVSTVDLYQYLLAGTVPRDARLESGDVVFVPVRGPRVSINGEIRRPAVYELKAGEGLTDLITAAAGFTARAHPENITVSRILPPEQRTDAGFAQTVLTVDYSAGASADIPLIDGDSVYVSAVSGPVRNAVEVIGSVWQPGMYQLPEGGRLSDLVAQAGGLRPETFAGRALIRRTRPDSSQFMIAVRLPDRVGIPWVDNPVLLERDQVRIFSLTEFRPAREIGIYGAVNAPGIYSYADSMTLRDAVLLAHGVQDDAFLLEAEITRLRGTEDTVAASIRVPLDSSFVFDATGHLVRDVGTAATPPVLLEPYDNVFIRRQPNLEAQQNVFIGGEVAFPGTYSLLTREDHLTDLLRRAGGLSRQAYPAGIRFFRSGGVGRVSVDLPAVLADPDHPDNLFLIDGDSIEIPKFIPTVRVEGAVLSPTSVTYVPGAKTEYYVDAAGGYVKLADKGRTFVQQPNGLIQRKNFRPQPGAIVVVPGKDPRDRGIDFAVLFGGIAQILSAVTTIILVLSRI